VSLLHEGEGYRIWFSWRPKRSIALAQRHPANPIIRPGKGKWDADAVALHEGEDLGF
jgi:hypothetical protein